MENINSFVRLVCGTDFDANKELDKILLHLEASLKKVTKELVEVQALSDEKLGLYGPYLGRAILELSMTALIARIDPFKILLMKGKQEQPTTIAMLQTRSILRQKASLHEKLQERRSRRFYLIQRGRSPFGEYNHQSIAI